MLRNGRPNPVLNPVLTVFACHANASLATHVLSFLYDPHQRLQHLPLEIVRFAWSSEVLYRYTVRFRLVDTPSVAADSDGSELDF